MQGKPANIESIAYKWSLKEASQAYFRALLSDWGIETLLRNHLQSRGIQCKTIGSSHKKTTCLCSGDLTAQPVLFLHGTPGSALSWWPYLKNPKPFYVMALDRPGFSPVNRNIPDPEKDIEILKTALEEAAQAQPVIIVGHSMGGGLAVRLAIDAPEKVKAVILIGASLDPDLEEIKPVQLAAQKAPLKFFLNRSARNSNEELIRYPSFLKTLKPRLRELKCPVLIVHAKKDGLVPFGNVAFMQTNFTGAGNIETIIEENGDHGIHVRKYRQIMQNMTALV
ncbi:MAG: alpha/beta hydrolase [Alphaproteobacteria bacterium]|nr:alpha/beta hydrolase [Alphaproteobacteria bacterium]